MATPVKRCFMLVLLCGSSGFDTTRQRLAVPEGDLTKPPIGNKVLVVSFRRTRNPSCRVSGPARRG
jgi:hypothetical protein